MECVSTNEKIFNFLETCFSWAQHSSWTLSDTAKGNSSSTKELWENRDFSPGNSHDWTANSSFRLSVCQSRNYLSGLIYFEQPTYRGVRQSALQPISTRKLIGWDCVKFQQQQWRGRLNLFPRTLSLLQRKPFCLVFSPGKIWKSLWWVSFSWKWLFGRILASVNLQCFCPFLPNWIKLTVVKLRAKNFRKRPRFRLQSPQTSPAKFNPSSKEHPHKTLTEFSWRCGRILGSVMSKPLKLIMWRQKGKYLPWEPAFCGDGYEFLIVFTLKYLQKYLSQRVKWLPVFTFCRPVADSLICRSYWLWDLSREPVADQMIWASSGTEGQSRDLEGRTPWISRFGNWKIGQFKFLPHIVLLLADFQNLDKKHLRAKPSESAFAIRRGNENKKVRTH